MPRGGKRTGTPGKAYQNRSDLGVNYASQQGTTTAAAGGVQAPPAPPAEQPGMPAPGADFPTPDDSPNLLDPTQRPDEPVTAGMAHGAGPGPEALGLDPRRQDVEVMRDRWMPTLEAMAEDPETPQSVHRLLSYIRSF